MGRMVLAVTVGLILTGCANHITRNGILSQELPLTIDDLSEIRAGEKNHEAVLEEYRVYSNPKLETYLNTVAANIAEVSTRPNLPYHVVLLDDDEINMFGGPGGYIYISRGMLDFVQSESEIAGLMAHEIGHISHYEYSNIPHVSKAKYVYDMMMKGSELAKDSIGTYGTAMNYGLKGIGKVAPRVARQFGQDAEIYADEKAVEFMMQAGYDPRGLLSFLERLSRIDKDDVGRFVTFMNAHPPFVDRRRLLEGRITGIDFENGKIEFKKDMLSEVKAALAAPPPAQEPPPQAAPESIIFNPSFGVTTSQVQMGDMKRPQAAGIEMQKN